MRHPEPQQRVSYILYVETNLKPESESVSTFLFYFILFAFVFCRFSTFSYPGIPDFQRFPISTGQRKAKGAKKVFNILRLRLGLRIATHRSLCHYGLSS